MRAWLRRFIIKWKLHTTPKANAYRCNRPSICIHTPNPCAIFIPFYHHLHFCELLHTIYKYVGVRALALLVTSPRRTMVADYSVFMGDIFTWLKVETEVSLIASFCVNSCIKVGISTQLKWTITIRMWLAVGLFFFLIAAFLLLLYLKLRVRIKNSSEFV